MSENLPTRRFVTRGMVVAALSGAGATATLTACGGGGNGSDGGSDDGGARGDGTVLARTTEIPEGGGKVFADEKVVVTQPTAGEFRAFSAVCTHAGCTVQDVSDGTINCPCHQSKFSIEDGSPAGGPAPKPLPRTEIRVENGSVRLA